MTVNCRSKLKMLFVSSDKYPPYRLDVAVLFGEKIAGRGHDIDWLLQSEKEADKSYVTRWKGGRVFVGSTCTRTTRTGRLLKHFRGIVNDARMWWLARKNKYDFIQVKDKFIAALIAIPLCRVSGIKFVYWLSYPIPEASIYAAKEGIARYRWIYLYRGMVLKFLLYKIILRKADRIFVQSDQMKRDIMAEGIPGEGIIPVPMGIDIDECPFRKKEYVEEGGHAVKNIVYIGTLQKVRRMDFMLRVMKLVLDSGQKAILYMVGSSEDPLDVEDLINQSKELGIDESVVFTGFVQRDEMVKYVNSAHVCVSPFFPTPILNSTSPTKLIEYMAFGKPVVANDHPEQSSVIEESGGGICVPYDEEEFAKAVSYLLANPEKAYEKGSLGREFVERVRSYDVIADNVEHEYMSLLVK